MPTFTENFLRGSIRERLDTNHENPRTLSQNQRNKIWLIAKFLTQTGRRQ